MSNDTPTRSAKRRKITEDPATSSTKTPTKSATTPTASRSSRRTANASSKRSTNSTEIPESPQEPDATESQEDASTSGNGQDANTKHTPQRRSGRGQSDHVAAEEDTIMLDATEASDEGLGLRSSGRQRRTPRRFSVEIERATEKKSLTRSAVKGAMKATPKTTTPRAKAQKVEPTEDVDVTDVKTARIGEGFGFKDIYDSATKLKRTPRAKAQTQHESTPSVTKEQPNEGLQEPNESTEAIPTPSKAKRKSKKAVSQEQEPPSEEIDIQDQPETLEPAVEVPELLETATTVSILGISPTDTEVDVDEETKHTYSVVQQIILSRLNGKRRTPLVALDEEYRKVLHVAEQTVVAGEGNSMLIIGPRGSGKTPMIETVVAGLEKDHQEDFHVVRLNGFLQTDDRLALREIWRQLGREMDTEEDANKISSYADTMASLLALLSHPEELSGETMDTSTTTKSIIFIIDEFDLFTTHPRQTLLYNLFDIAQARKAPIAVFGLSTKVDVAEHLEKRVKSRFSHRYVYLAPAKNLPMFTEMCKSALRIHEEDLEEGEESNQEIVLAKETWNEHLDTLLATSPLLTHLRSHYTLSKSLPALLTTFLLPLSHPSFHPTFPLTPTPLPLPDSLLTPLPSLPRLPLLLLIASARLTLLLGTSLLNFNMVYHEYTSLCSRARITDSSLGAGVSAASIRVWGRDISRSGWETLEQGGWIIPASSDAAAGAGGGGAGGGRDEGMYRVDVTLEEIDAACSATEGGEGGLGRVERGWCREL